MTDNEIMQALKCCSVFDCDSCPLCSYGDTSVVCSGYLYGEIIDLINRQRAEIGRMKENHVKNFEKWELLDRKTKQFYAERYEEAKEIVKAEAIKEFAEKLKNKVIVDLFCGVDSADYLDDILFKNIDNLVKEMVGGKC